MAVALITGSGGLIGSEAALHFGGLGMDVVGIDNDMRAVFFGPDGSTRSTVDRLRHRLGDRYHHCDSDIRDQQAIDGVFRRYGEDIRLVVHTAAQPSHDWAARAPDTDFGVNAVGTLNLLESTRRRAPDSVFIFTSTNKVYGDRPNQLPLIEMDTRWELPLEHEYFEGIPEDMSIDSCLHSIFGVSKTAADLMVQEYGLYFGLKTVCFRGGTLTGPSHAAAELHGFLAYLMRCTMSGRSYRVYGYKGKQVRDAIHAADLVSAFDAFFRAPRTGAVYNIGGGRLSNCSVIEAIALCEEISGQVLKWSYDEENRVGDHIWWIGSNARFEDHYPSWKQRYSLKETALQIYEQNRESWMSS